MSQVLYKWVVINESCHIWISRHEWGMPRLHKSWHTSMRHVSFEKAIPCMQESCQTWIQSYHACFMSCMHESCHMWMGHVTYERVVSHREGRGNGGSSWCMCKVWSCAVCCSMLQYVAVCCSVLCSLPAVCFSVLQCAVACCSMLCRVLQCVLQEKVETAADVCVWYEVAQRVAAWCRVLQSVAACCSLLQCVVQCLAEADVGV